MVIPRGGRFGARVVENGSQRWVGTFDTREEAGAAIEAAKEVQGRPVTVGEWARQWERVPGKDGPRTAATVRHNARMVAAFVESCGGHELGKVPATVLLELIASSPGRARYVRTMFEDAKRFRLLEENPLAGLVPSWKSPEVVPPTREQLDRMLTGLESEGAWARTLAGVAAWSGLRWSEVSVLRVENVDVGLPDTVIALNAQLPPRVTLDVEHGKGDLARRSVLFEPGAVALRDYMLPCAPERLVFPSLSSGVIPRQTYNSLWCRTREKVGLPELRFHDLRHFHATWLLDQGASDLDVAIQLGHRDGGEQVRKTYGHPSRERALERLRVLADRRVA